MRIQCFLRDHQFGSRRDCDLLVKKKLVKVNGSSIDLGYFLNAGDIVEARGKKIVFSGDISRKQLYIRYNKPRGIVCSHNDEWGRKTIVKNFESIPILCGRKIFFIGRLDIDSRGLILLSTDPSFVHKIAHPSNGCTKDYVVTTQMAFNKKLLEELSRGFSYQNEYYAPFIYKIVHPSRFFVTLSQGKNRQIRIICELMKNRAVDILRTRVGPYRLMDLEKDQFSFFKIPLNSNRVFVD